jgi:hypothetical protein
MIDSTRVSFFRDICKFNPKQIQAAKVADSHRYTLFGGSRGPGKSYFLRWYVVRFLFLAYGKGFPGMRAMLASEDYPSLYDRQISKVQLEFPDWLGEYNGSRNEYRLAPKWGSGVIAFRNLNDPSKYQSTEFGLIAVDELTKNTRRTFDILRASMRWPGFEGVRFVAASNPEPNWVRDFWISRQFPEELQGDAEQFAFVPALPDDNPHLPKSYWSMLDTLPGALRAAWRHGDWFAAVEGLVYDTFNADNLTDEDPIQGTPIEIAIDDGYNPDPRATLFIQRQPNCILVFDELYQYKRLEENTVEDIKQKCAANGWPLPELAVVSHEAPALRERLRTADIPTRNWLATKKLLTGDRSKRVAAIKHTRGLFCDGQGYRVIKIHRRCAHLIDEITAGYRYPQGKHSADDLPEDGNDHCANALETFTFVRVRTGRE